MAISALQIRVWLFRHYKYVHVGNVTAAAAVATALCVAILLLFLLLLAAAVCHRTPTTRGCSSYQQHSTVVILVKLFPLRTKMLSEVHRSAIYNNLSCGRARFTFSIPPTAITGTRGAAGGRHPTSWKPERSLRKPGAVGHVDRSVPRAGPGTM